MKRFELFTAPQEDRVAALETTVVAWIDALAPGEQLVIGLPAVLGVWEVCLPLVVGPGMQERFLEWLQASAKGVRGPYYNLPPLNVYFLCMVIDEDFDPRTTAVPEDATEELKGVLIALGNYMDECESMAA